MDRWILFGIFSIVVGVTAWMWLSVYGPDDAVPAPVVCAERAPKLVPGQSLKVLNWNVQFMAGKNYYFFYEGGPDARPSRPDVDATLREVARVIEEEDPDIVLLQEVYDGASHAGYEDQLARLLSLLPRQTYPCRASAFYWKAAFVPHPRLMGAVGMKLAILSKYALEEALRHPLARIPSDPITRHFNVRRAVLEVRMPIENGGSFAVLVTHLDAFAQGTDTMERQVNQVLSILEKIGQEGHPWVIGGDFNLLPPGQAYALLPDDQKKQFKEETELAPMFERYRSVPSLEEVNGPHYRRWFTHFPNDPRVGTPNKTIDYIFLGNDLRIGKHSVRQHDTLSISDHLPVVAQFDLP